MSPPARGLTRFALLGVCCTTTATGLHVAFVLPPASPMGAMLPVAAGAIDAGHNVTVLAWDEYAAKVTPMMPRAKVLSLGPAVRPQRDNRKFQLMMDVPYEVGAFLVNTLISFFDVMAGVPLARAALPELRRVQPDVLCVTNILPSGYALSELLDIPVVGLGFGAPWLFSNILEPVWSLEPALGSWYTREEIAASPLLIAWNLALRVQGLLVRGTLGMVANNIARWQLGLSRMEFSQYESIIANPMIVPALPETTIGYPALVSSNTVMAGMYDHSSLGGASMSRSSQHDEIMAWLDSQLEKNSTVLYCAFGSEVDLDLARAEQLLKAFGSTPVLWVLKKRPQGLTTPLANIFIAKWSQQKAVLKHPAVKAFFSHGGGNSVREALAAGVPMIIMPFVGDQPMNAMINEALGVAIRVHKNSFTPQSLAASFARVCEEDYQQRAAEIKALNDKHASLARAVEVVEGVANRRFPMRVSQRNALTSLVPITFLVLAVLVLRAGCLCFCRCCSRCCRHRPVVGDEQVKGA